MKKYDEIKVTVLEEKKVACHKLMKKNKAKIYAYSAASAINATLTALALKGYEKVKALEMDPWSLDYEPKELYQSGAAITGFLLILSAALLIGALKEQSYLKDSYKENVMVAERCR